MAREKVFNMNTISTAVENGDNDNYLTGQMGFVLEFAGVYEKYDDDDEISNLPGNEIKDLGEKIRDYLLKTQEIIKNTPSWAAERLLERALLSLGMYLRTNSSNRYNFCNTSEQYNTWKIMLYVEKDNKYCRDIFKELLDKVSIGNIERDLQQIILEHSSDTRIPEWRRLIINKKELIDYCTKGFLYIEDPSKIENDDVDVILLSQSQMNHYHSELRSRNLYESCKTNCPISYRIQKSYDADTCVSIQFSKDGKQYEYLLSYWDGKWSSKIRDENDDDVSSLFQFGNMTGKNGEERLNLVIKYLNDNGYVIV